MPIMEDLIFRPVVTIDSLVVSCVYIKLVAKEFQIKSNNF